MSVADFFAFARAREEIRLRKEAGLPAPWTEDPILRDFYFCNVFREDDRTTRWFRENIRGPLRDHRAVITATIVFRWFNYIPTGEKIRSILLRGDLLVLSSGKRLAPLLHAALRPGFDAGEKLITGAFIVKTPDGYDKLNGILRCVDAISHDEPAVSRATTLADAHAALRWIPYLGPFMAYEIVTDLRHTASLARAPDVDTWASAGPGAMRGLAWTFNLARPPSYTSLGGQDEARRWMRTLLDSSRDSAFWPPEWRRWEMREVEHTLCEFDKYRRAQNGEPLKRRYRADDRRP